MKISICAPLPVCSGWSMTAGKDEPASATQRLRQSSDWNQNQRRRGIPGIPPEVGNVHVLMKAANHMHPHSSLSDTSFDVNKWQSAAPCGFWGGGNCPQAVNNLTNGRQQEDVYPMLSGHICVLFCLWGPAGKHVSLRKQLKCGVLRCCQYLATICLPCLF